jgi:hypothetical protein
MTDVPEVILRYIEAAASDDLDTLTACFTVDGKAVDEGETYEGRDAIRGWREAVRSKYTYTAEVTGTRALGDDRHGVDVHVVGDFPGGVVDLTYAFTLRGDLIAALEVT